jgi:PAS domain S-box-containing protein
MPGVRSETASPLTADPREQAWLTYQALNHSDDIVLLLETDILPDTSDAVIIAANGSFRRATGCSNEELLGRKASDLFRVHTDSETLMNAVRGRAPRHAELTCGQAGAKSFMLGVHVMAAPERTPGRLCSVVLGRDITALVAARREQNATQRLLAKVFMCVDEAVAIVSAAGRIAMTNPGVDRLLGYKPNAIIGMDSLFMVPAECRETVSNAVRQQFATGINSSFESQLIRADGTVFAASITSVLVTTDDVKQFRIVTLRSTGAGKPAMRTESAGRIKLIGVDEVRAALGDRWAAMAERAMATAESVIRRRCGPQDSFSRVDDTSFLMCFGALSEKEAAFRAATIGREIRDRLIGQGDDPDTSYIRTIAASVKFPDEGQTGGDLHSVLMNGLDQQLERIEQEARSTLQSAVANATCDMRPVLGRNATETIATRVCLSGEFERRVTTSLSALPSNESNAFDQDGLLLALATRHVIATMSHGDAPPPLLVNVRFNVFATRPATERYFATCQKVDARIAKRIVLLLSLLPQGLPRTRLLECINRLRPFCRDVGYEVEDLASLALIDLSFSAAAIVSISAAALGSAGPVKVRALFSSLHARRGKVLVSGVRSNEDATALRALGADMISMHAL